MSIKSEINFEVADRVTLLNLINTRDYLQSELSSVEDSKWLHHDDVVKNKKLIEMFDEIIKYYGGY